MSQVGVCAAGIRANLDPHDQDRGQAVRSSMSTARRAPIHEGGGGSSGR